jgi:hypothetical protein
MPVLALCVAAVSASATGPVKGKDWKNAPVYDVTRLASEIPQLLGKVIGIRFVSRGKNITGIRPRWSEGSLWQPNASGKGYSFVRILVNAEDLEAFKALTTDVHSPQLQIVYGIVEQQPEAGWLYVRLFRTTGGGSKHVPAD